jgi:hypothetical protein
MGKGMDFNLALCDAEGAEMNENAESGLEGTVHVKIGLVGAVVI